MFVAGSNFSACASFQFSRENSIRCDALFRKRAKFHEKIESKEGKSMRSDLFGIKWTLSMPFRSSLMRDFIDRVHWLSKLVIPIEYQIGRLNLHCAQVRVLSLLFFCYSHKRTRTESEISLLLLWLVISLAAFMILVIVEKERHSQSHYPSPTLFAPPHTAPIRIASLIRNVI